MRNIISIVSSILLIPSLGFAKVSERKLYVGSNSTEAIVEFDTTVKHNTSSNITEKTMRKVIENQLEHIIGPISLAEYTAVPKGDHTVTNVKIIKKTSNEVEIAYHYKGTMVVENGPTKTYDIIIPVNPSKIYSASMIGENNPCTDDHYQSEGDFWYFWSPEREGCKLIAGKDYKIIKASLKRIQNSKVTYPEYHNLKDEKGNINIHVLFGMDEPETSDRSPLKSKDTNAYNYRSIRETLIKKGYISKVWTLTDVKKVAKTNDGAIPYVETLTKGKIVYRFMFAPTGINEESLGFHWFFKDALENSSIMIYSGHSGLGGHLDLDSIEANLGETIKFNPNKYQIYFFDSCTSYKYYNSMYLDRKATSKDPKGTKSLDIFVNGLATFFHTMPDSITAIATAVESALDYANTGKGFISYQTLAKQIDSDNLFGIVGDEDNEAPKKL